MAKTSWNERRIGFIGCGAMARALAGGLVEAGVSVERIRASDPVAEARKGFASAIPAQVFERNDDVVAASDLVVLAVKPGAVPAVLGALDPKTAARPIWVSIAAGVPLAALVGALRAAHGSCARCRTRRR